MPNIEITTQVRGQGLFFSGTSSRTEEGGSSVDVTIPIAHAGVLTTRTDNETGSITMDAGGHGITTGQIIDLYWATGARYAILVGTVSGTTVPIGADNSGNGNNLPTAATAVVVAPRVSMSVLIDVLPSMLAFVMQYASTAETAVSHVSMHDDSAEVESFNLAANIPRVWDVEGGDENIAEGGDTTSLIVSQASTTSAATFRGIWGGSITT